MVAQIPAEPIDGPWDSYFNVQATIELGQRRISVATVVTSYVILMLLLAIIVLVLHLNEKVRDVLRVTVNNA